jgi:hypothetical protein
VQIVPPGGLLRTSTKTLTFTGAAGAGQSASPIVLFTVTGAVDVSLIAGYCTTSLTSGGGGTLALGATGSTSLFIGATTAANITSTANVWVSTTPTAVGLAVPAALKDIIVTGAQILGTVATADITAGVLVITCYWLPISVGGSVA